MKRPSLSLVLAALLLLIAFLCFACALLAGFSGEIRIREGSAEAMAVAPASYLSIPRATLRRNVVGREIPFADSANARGWIDENRYYDVASLPFALSVVHGEVREPRVVGGSLVVSGSDGEVRAPAEVGKQVLVDGTSYTVRLVRGWSGLVSAPGSSAMAAVVITADSTNREQETLLMPDGAWMPIDSNTALHFVWTTSEEAFSATDIDSVQGNTARWGVSANGQTEWLSTFQPGSGLESSDGTNVELIRRNDAFADSGGVTSAIEVAVHSHGKTQRLWVRANAALPESPVRYENLAVMPRILHVVAWEPGRIAIFVGEHGESPVRESSLGRGETWAGPGLTLKLDDVLPSATAVTPEASSLYEAMLESDGQQISVPEHRPFTLGNMELRFEPRIVPAQVAYQLAIYRVDSPTPEVERLEPRGSLRVDSWTIQQQPDRQTSEEIAVLRVRNNAPTFWFVVGVLAALGGAGVLAKRLLRYKE